MDCRFLPKKIRCPCEQANSQTEISPPFSSWIMPCTSTVFLSPPTSHFFPSSHILKKKLQDSVDFLPPPCATMLCMGNPDSSDQRPTLEAKVKELAVSVTLLWAWNNVPWMVPVVHPLSCCFKTPTSGFKHVKKPIKRVKTPTSIQHLRFMLV
jgi:hypothetical protein